MKENSISNNVFISVVVDCDVFCECWYLVGVKFELFVIVFLLVDGYSFCYQVVVVVEVMNNVFDVWIMLGSWWLVGEYIECLNDV